MKSVKLLLLFTFSVFSAFVSAQQNTDSIFARAVSEGNAQQYDRAIEEAKKAYDTDSNRGDILVYIANVFSWKNDNESSLIYLNKAKALNYKSDDYFETLTNVLLRSEKYDALLVACNEAEQNKYSNTQDLLRKKLIAFTELEDYKSGVEYAELLPNKIYIDSELISDLYTNLLLKRNTNVISAFYSLDLVDGLTPMDQHLASIGYSFAVGKHTLGFRANYASRFGRNDFQVETDFYLKLRNAHYMYFNYGYGINSTLFPNHRIGYEYFFPLPYKMEASLGARYLNYQLSTEPHVFILTGHLGKYFNKSRVSLRPFYVIKGTSQSLSFIADYRLYGKTELDYWGLDLGFGNSPDDIYSTSQTGGFNQLTAYKVKLIKNFMINRTSDLHVGFGYTYEEHIVNQFRNRFTVELGYKIRLK
jgi:YaiO family outer membrane protein